MSDTSPRQAEKSSSEMSTVEKRAIKKLKKGTRQKTPIVMFIRGERRPV